MHDEDTLDRKMWLQVFVPGKDGIGIARNGVIKAGNIEGWIAIAFAGDRKPAGCFRNRTCMEDKHAYYAGEKYFTICHA